MSARNVVELTDIECGRCALLQQRVEALAALLPVLENCHGALAEVVDQAWLYEGEDEKRQRVLEGLCAELREQIADVLWRTRTIELRRR